MKQFLGRWMARQNNEYWLALSAGVLVLVYGVYEWFVFQRIINMNTYLVSLGVIVLIYVWMVRQLGLVVTVSRQLVLWLVGIWAITMLVVLPARPNVSNDDYWILLSVRGYSEYQLSPYTTTAEQLRFDSWSQYNKDWWGSKMVYGPLLVLTTAPLTRLSESLPVVLIGQRVIAIGLFGVSMFCLWRILQKHRVSSLRQFQTLAAAAFSPFLMQSLFFDLHNDIWMMTGIILSYWLYLQKKYFLSGWSLIVVGFVKYFSWYLLPIPIVAIWQERCEIRKKVLKTAILIGGFVVLAWILYLPFGGISWKVFSQLRQEASKVGIEGGLIGTNIMLSIWPLKDSFTLRIFCFGVGGLWMLWLVRRREILKAYTLPFCLIFAFGTPWFQAWYFNWIILLLAVVLDLNWFIFLTIFLFIVETMSTQSGEAIMVLAVIFSFANQWINKSAKKCKLEKSTGF